MAVLAAKQVGDDRQKSGLVDGGVYNFSCDSCGKAIVDLQITRPDYDIQANYQARCPYCQNYSKKKFIKGGFCLVGIGEIDQNGKDVDKTAPSGGYEVADDGTVILEVIKL